MGPQDNGLHVATFGDVQRALEHPALDLELLWWLIWMPLQRAEEVARCRGVPLKKIYDRLASLERARLLEHISLAEPNVPRHRRYYVTDLGLYVFAELVSPSFDVRELTQTYQIRERDLLVSILHTHQLLYLTDLISRLVADGRAEHTSLRFFQQPARLGFKSRGRRQTFLFDAEIGIESESGQTHTFCLLIDTWEQSDVRQSQSRAWLDQLIDACEAALWSRLTVPTPLIVTLPSRLLSWGTLLQQAREKRGIHLPPGGITTPDRGAEGAFASIWWPLARVADWSGEQGAAQTAIEPERTACISLRSFFASTGNTASSTREDAGTQPPAREEPRTSLRTPRPPERALARYVRGGFAHSAHAIDSHDLARCMEQSDVVAPYALLTLRLTGLEKSVLSLLGRHLLLSVTELAAILTPESASARSVELAMNTLRDLHLVHAHAWQQERKPYTPVQRYTLTETALRYLVERNNLPLAHYLEAPQDVQEEAGADPSWMHRGLAGLEAKMDHTIGFLRCMVGAMRHAHRLHDHEILWWKSAREAVRWYRDPEQHPPPQIRPDGEVCFRLRGSEQCTTLFIEYDRATMSRRDYKKKFSAYHKYRCATASVPPAILVITQDAQTARSIRDVATEVDKHLSVLIILEDELLRSGLVRSLACQPC